jgi:hypothetical protein
MPRKAITKLGQKFTPALTKAAKGVSKLSPTKPKPSSGTAALVKKDKLEKQPSIRTMYKQMKENAKTTEAIGGTNYYSPGRGPKPKKGK